MRNEQQTTPTWLDRLIGFVDPQAGLRRMRARVAADLMARHYEGAAPGRRTQGWNRSTGDSNAVVGPALARLREAARDLVRNNGYAESALTTICDHVVGWGITAKPDPVNAKVAETWKRWAESTDCDADGRNDLYGLEKLVMRTVVESGECLVRRRLRRPEDGFVLPMQLQVLDPDHLDTMKSEMVRSPQGAIVGKIIQGVEFDLVGRRVAYWLFPEHPGSLLGAMGEAMTGFAGLGIGTSRRIPAESVLHVYKHSRPGQVRGPSWFAPVLLTFKDFDEFEDATLMKQKIAACLAVLTSDVDGSAPTLGKDAASADGIDSLEPGMILNVPPGRSIEVVQPPTVREYPDFARVNLRRIATGLGVTYEDLTGDYAGMPFSAARMSRLRHWARVDDWRWRTLIPQFCNPVWRWAVEVMQIMNLAPAAAPYAVWTAPPPAMVDPTAEGQAYQRNVRTGIMTLSEAIRERGYDPETLLTEMAADNKRLDELGLILDSDARNTTQQGLPRVQQQAAAAKDEGAPDKADEDVAADENTDEGGE